MATTTNAATKTPKEKKAPIPAAIRITKTLKAEALRGKLTADELDKLATLATSLKVFLEA